MKLLEFKAPINDYLVVVRNHQRLLNGDSLPKHPVYDNLTKESGCAPTEQPGLGNETLWPDPDPG